MKKRIICWMVIIFGLGLLSARSPLDELYVEIGPEQSICFNNQPDTIFSLITGGSGNFDYTWELTLDTTTSWTGIPNADTSFYRPDLLQRTTFYRLIVKDEGNNKEDTSNYLKIHVFQEISLDTISGGNSPVCYEGDAGWLEAIYEGGSEDQRVVWYNQDDDSLGQGDKYHVTGLTENTTFHFFLKDEQCGEYRSNDKLIEVLPQVSAGPITGAPLNKICYGDDPGVLTAHPAGGQEDFTIEWKKGDGTTLFTNYDPPWEYNVPSLMVTTQYYYIVHDPCGTDESEKETIEVYPLLEAGDITGVSTTVCYDEDPGTLEANPQGGSNTWIEYQWYNDDDELLFSSPADSYPIGRLNATTGFYYIVKDQSCGSATSSTLFITVRPKLNALPITGGITPICENYSGGTLTAEATGGSLNYIFSWHRWNNDVGAHLGDGKTFDVGLLTETTSFCYIVRDDDTDCGADTSAPMTIEVQDFISPQLTIASSQTDICQGETVTFTANPVPPMSDQITYKWKLGDDVVSTLATYTTGDLEQGNTVEVEVTYSPETCVTPKTISETTTVTVKPVPDDRRGIVAKPHNAPVVLIYPGDTTGTAYGTVFSYMWLANGVAMNPPENRKFYYNQHLDPNITYSVRVFNEHGCFTELFYQPDMSKSLLFGENDIFTIYPNPTAGEFSVIFNEDILPADVQTFTLRICDLSGKEVSRRELPLGERLIRPDALTKGVYMLEVTVDGGYRQVRKLVIQ